MLTSRQEKFALLLFQDVPQREAWGLAGYSSNYSLAAIDVNASRLANLTKVKLRIQELRSKVEAAAISTVKERQKILTQIQRATVADFVDEYGNLNIKNKAQLQTSAVQEIRTERTLAGYRTTLKLRDPVGAIAEHNKMDKIYSEAPQLNDNRVFNFYGSQEGKDLTAHAGDRLLEEGED